MVKQKGFAQFLVMVLMALGFVLVLQALSPPAASAEIPFTKNFTIDGDYKTTGTVSLGTVSLGRNRANEIGALRLFTPDFDGANEVKFAVGYLDSDGGFHKYYEHDTTTTGTTELQIVDPTTTTGKARIPISTTTSTPSVLHVELVTTPTATIRKFRVEGIFCRRE